MIIDELNTHLILRADRKGRGGEAMLHGKIPQADVDDGYPTI